MEEKDHKSNITALLHNIQHTTHLYEHIRSHMSDLKLARIELLSAHVNGLAESRLSTMKKKRNFIVTARRTKVDSLEPLQWYEQHTYYIAKLR